MSHPSSASPRPGVCTGSSTRHIVTFDGQNFKLTGSCSYVLFQNKEQDLEVILHNGACSPAARQGCMKSIEVKHAALSVELHSDMEVRSTFSGSRGKAIECQGNHMDQVAVGFSWCSCQELCLLLNQRRGAQLSQRGLLPSPCLGLISCCSGLRFARRNHFQIALNCELSASFWHWQRIGIGIRIVYPGGIMSPMPKPCKLSNGKHLRR